MFEINISARWSYNGRTGTEVIFREALAVMRDGLGDWSPAFSKISGVLESAVATQFATAGQGEWAPLAESTVKRKGHDTILIETDAMRQSFQSGGSDHIENITRTRLEWGSGLLRALFHQTGTGSGFQQRFKGPGRGMPMRKILMLTAANKRAMRSIMVGQMANIARRAGFAALSGQTDVDPLLARMAGSRLLGI